jgi:predicted transcriptional regulator
MKPVRLGQGIEKRRQKANLSREQLARNVGIPEIDLCRLEEGCVSDLDSKTLKTLRSIAQDLGFRGRGKITHEHIISFFINIPQDDRPILF